MAVTARIRITRVTDADELTSQIAPKMDALGRAIAVRAQRLVPKRTWALHDTIATDTEIRGAIVVTQVGFGDDDVDYGLYVERGTSKMKAQPFLRPALLQTTSGDFRFSGNVRAHGILATSARTRRRTRTNGLGRLTDRGGDA